MKKAKKMLAWMMLAGMTVTGGAAQAEGIACAAAPLEIRSFEYYPSHTHDAETGKWSVRANEADALVERFWSYGLETGSRLCVFNLELEGNALTGIRTPVLRFYYMNGSDDIDARAVSVLVGDTRYDFAASSSEATNGRYTAEMISVPLTREALEAVHAMLNSEEVSVRLMGDAVYTFELDTENTAVRSKLQAESLSGLEAGMMLLDEAGMNEYELWDLSADAWKNEYGYAPAYARSTVVTQLGEVELTDDFGMVMRYDQTKAAREAQEILIDGGFLSGTASGTFTKNAASAARRAQHYLGLIETGGVDAQLAEAIEKGPAVEEAAEKTLDPLGELAEIRLERYWFADAVSASNSTESPRAVMNGDNVFLVLDGTIRNISPAELRMFIQMEAKLVYNDTYAYEATIVCERNEGGELDMSMLPMAESRLLVYAEIPASVARDEGASWRVELSAGSDKLEYELQ